MRLIVTCVIEDEENAFVSSSDAIYEEYALRTNDAIRAQIERALHVTADGGRVIVSAKPDDREPIVTIVPRADLGTPRDDREPFLRAVEYAWVGPEADEPTLVSVGPVP